MADNQATFIQLPMDIEDPEQLKRFLSKLLEQLNIAFGNIGVSAFADLNTTNNSINSINSNIGSIELKITTNSNSINTNSSNITTNSNSITTNSNNISVNSSKITTINNELPNYEPKFTKNTAFNKNFGTTSGTVTEGGTTTNNPIQSSIAKLTQAISSPPTQVEVQTIQDKVNSIITALTGANII